MGRGDESVGDDHEEGLAGDGVGAEALPGVRTKVRMPFAPDMRTVVLTPGKASAAVLKISGRSWMRRPTPIMSVPHTHKKIRCARDYRSAGAQV